MKGSGRDFSFLVGGQVVSVFGAAVLKFALSLYVLDLTGRADIFGTLLALSIIPGVILAPFGGAVADRFNRRNLMVIFDFCSFLLISVFYLFLNAGQVSIMVVGITITMLTLVSSLYQPTVRASIPALVAREKLARANGLTGGVAALSNLAGPVVGGVLYNFIGLESVILIGAIAFLLSAIMEMFIRLPFTRQETSEGMVALIRDDMRQGMRFIFREKPYIARTMLLASSLNLFLMPFFVIGIPYILRVTMRSNDIRYGLAMGIIQLSSIFGALSVDRLSTKLRLDTLPRWIALIACLSVPMALSLSPGMLSAGYWPSYISFLFFAVPVVMILAMLSVFAVTIIQRETPDHLLGKVMAIIGTAAQAAAPIGQLLYGFLFEVFSLQVFVPTLVAGSATLMLSFLAYWLLGRNPRQLAALQKGLSA